MGTGAGIKKWNKYAQVSKTNLSNSLVYFWNFISKNLFFVIIMFIYMSLWKNIYAQKGAVVGGLTYGQMLWYLIITELITLSRTELHFQINEDVKSGNIAYLLNKPYNYVLYCFSYFLGEIGFKLLANGIVGILIGAVFAGRLQHFSPAAIPFILLSILLGCCINFFIYISLALTSFWFEDNTALFWIYSKLIFTLGGMLLPLELFPKVLRQIAQYLPFAYVTYVPARLTVNFTFERFVPQCLAQVGYLLLFFGVAMLLYRKGVRQLNVNGG